ncbi:STAS domain-containing protein [Nonomuraea africana]|uniref:Anti-sigma factor antagonist n=1 Tax=Nonomuraea africana TaxID=46171 RepID=A0ABR9KR37_9ACTN|nr:STAS domain-containing protein [Nonomuraea africana]MBE1564073.1 anti-anti-sigma factor [Nonomuraea africana]
MEALSLSCQHLPGVTLIQVGGELDVTNDAQFAAFVRQARRRPADHLVFDLGELTFMGSSGLRVVLDAYRSGGSHGGAVYLAALRPEPARLVEITGAGRHLRVHATAQEALAHALAAGSAG